MIAQQPLDKLPRLSDTDLHGSWLNKKTKGGRDYSPDGLDMTRMGLSTDERVGASFDGAADYLRRAEAGWRSGDSLGAVSCWVKTTSANGWIFSSTDEGSTTRYFGVVMLAGVLALWQRNADTATQMRANSVLIDDGVWHHIVMMSDGAAYIAYVDGELEALTTVAGEDNGDWLAETSNRDNIVMGAFVRTSVSDYFDGEIKDVRYHSRVLTQAEITAQYRAGVPDDSLALHLLKGQRDLSRYSAEFDNVNGVVLGHEMEFDGSTNYLRRAVSDWRIADSQGAVSAWFKLNSIGAIQVVLASADEASTLRKLRIEVDAANTIGITQDNNDTDDVVHGSTALVANVWYHAVWLSTGTAYKLYLNGVEETLVVNSGSDSGDWLADTADRDNITIGVQVRTTANFFFDGKIKDLQYHSELKSADWVKNIYDKTKIYY